ncbi:hypothetical protein [Clostridium beijerinckii]|uniref:Uncharacterized protein (DUF4213/DUF364 family) n=1 Tax=Clostridium beijerinckii TaxID=1520 RepID=A0AAX0B130_CLOBE|nr:hypothetical protein [Clostridium beijerinckii]NRT88134.1 uncharacterized protein (DUF4213/DUF364 family) [Clostridium beijerinckii]NYC73562.1 uncharacterized protein (DUF4213/DUF364 family) [Clostridium beijerinckii]
MPKVITYKKMKNEVETVMSYGDVLNIIEENLGAEVVNALLDFNSEEADEYKSNIIDYIEDGTFSEHIRESGLIEKFTNNILNSLEYQGYLKKNRNIKNFISNEEELVEIIDSNLSPGMMKYFEE